MEKGDAVGLRQCAQSVVNLSRQRHRLAAAPRQCTGKMSAVVGSEQGLWRLRMVLSPKGPLLLKLRRFDIGPVVFDVGRVGGSLQIGSLCGGQGAVDLPQERFSRATPQPSMLRW